MHFRPRQSSNVESRRRATASSDICPSDDASSIQLSSGNFGDRLKEWGKEKMVVIGAAMRKLLHSCYGVLKSGRPFDAPDLIPS